MSKLMEDFLRNHRHEMDVESPDRRVWAGIHQAMNPRPKRMIYWQVAAIFFFCCSAWLLFSGNPSGKELIALNTKSQPSITGIEDFYAFKINQQEAWLSNNSPAGTTPGIEYQRLTSMYEVLRLAWDKNPSEELRDAMALNLIIRLNFLDRLTESGLERGEKRMTSSGMVYR
jgi:hypothetical protein